MLARRVPAVVQAPQLRPLPARIPAAEGVAQREDPLLRAGPLLVAPGAADHRVEPLVGDGVEQRHGLQRVAGAVGPLGEPAVVDPVLHLRHLQPQVPVSHDPVPVLEHLGEVVPGVDVQQRERQRRGRRTPCSARCSTSTESLPAENRITGRSNWPATSRRMWIASDSSARRCGLATAARAVRVGRRSVTGSPLVGEQVEQRRRRTRSRSVAAVSIRRSGSSGIS